MIAPARRGKPRLKRALQALERWWHAAFVRMVGAVAGSQPRQPPDWGARPRRVLYLRDERIGDMIMATSQIRAIAQSHPTVTVDVLTREMNLPVLEGNRHVRRVWVFDRRRRGTWPRLLVSLRRARYDAVIDGEVLRPTVSTTTLFLMLATGAPYRIGIASRRNGFWTLPVPPADPQRHLIEQTAPLTTPFGVEPGTTDWRPEIVLREAERVEAERIWSNGEEGVRLLVNIASADPTRRWPRDRFVSLLRHVRAQHPGVQPLLIGPPEDRAEVVEIGHEAGVRALVPGLRAAFALVATADVLLTPETSLSHAASAFRKPAVVLLPDVMAMFGPYRTPGRNLFAPQRPIETLPFETVLAALEEVLADASAGQPRSAERVDAGA